MGIWEALVIVFVIANAALAALCLASMFAPLPGSRSSDQTSAQQDAHGKRAISRKRKNQEQNAQSKSNNKRGISWQE